MKHSTVTVLKGRDKRFVKGYIAVVRVPPGSFLNIVVTLLSTCDKAQSLVSQPLAVKFAHMTQLTILYVCVREHKAFFEAQYSYSVVK